MKSNIPWDNYVMRKFGFNIRKNIAELGVKSSVNIKTYKTLAQHQELDNVIEDIKNAFNSGGVK